MTNREERRFRELYGEHWCMLLGYAVRRTNSAEEAADVVGETFLVAWRKPEGVPTGDDEARLWLYGVARNVLRNQHRSANRRTQLGQRLQQHIQSNSLHDWEDAAVTRHLMIAAMAKLDEDDRELLRLANWEGLSPTEIAFAAGIPAPTVRTRLHRARNRLRQQLAELGWDSERSASTGQAKNDEQMLGPRSEERS